MKKDSYRAIKTLLRIFSKTEAMIRTFTEDYYPANHQLFILIERRNNCYNKMASICGEYGIKVENIRKGKRYLGQEKEDMLNALMLITKIEKERLKK